MRYKIFYGDNENDFVVRELEEKEIINGYLSELSAFNIFFENMIMCNNIFECNITFDNIVSNYDEEEDYYYDEFQYFIVDFDYDIDIIENVIRKMNNTLYYFDELDLYVMGVTDLGTNRRIVATNIKVEEFKGW